MIIPIKENGEEKLYETTANHGEITVAFLQADSIEDMKNYIEGIGQEFKEHNDGLRLSFDEK